MPVIQCRFNASLSCRFLFSSEKRYKTVFLIIRNLTFSATMVPCKMRNINDHTDFLLLNVLPDDWTMVC